jgi:hypothetical protein
MPYRKLMTIIIPMILSLCFLPSTNAQDGNQQQPQKPTSDQGEWFSLQAKLQVLKSKIKSKTDIVRKLINDKAVTTDEKKAVAIVNELKTEYRDLQLVIREYEEQRSLMNYRFPEKGRSEKRTYERVEIKPLEQMETEFSLEGKVRKTVTRLRHTYPTPAPKKVEVETPTVAVEPIRDPSRISTQESQILSK